MKFTAALIPIIALLLVPFGCDLTSSNADDGPRVVEVIASGQNSFEVSASEIPAGWTTFRFTNASPAVHFVILEKMPVVDGEQKTVEDSKAQVVPVFQNIMDDINGNAPSFPDAGFDLPAWYPDVLFVGGPGLTSSSETSETTVNLEPGTYVIECYVKMEDGTFHSTDGMIEGLTVIEASTSEAPPQPSAQVTVSSTEGITVDEAIRTPGKHTVQVRFEDQTAYAHFLGHDVHIARIDGGADMEALEAWMNWATPGGLAEPVPSGIEFLGGAQDMPGGSTAYLNVDLQAGEYAWIAEVPDPAAKGMLETFTVPSE